MALTTDLIDSLGSLSWFGSHQQVRKFLSYQNDQSEDSDLPYLHYHHPTF